MDGWVVEYEARLETESRSWDQVGFWIASDQIQVLQAVTQRDGSQVWLRGIWDGVRCTVASGSGPAPHMTEQIASTDGQLSVKIADSRTIAPFNYNYTPSRFGIGTASWNWSKLLPRMSDIAIVGREELFGIDCLVVRFDMDLAHPNDGQYQALRVVYFDDGEELLARRVISFLRDSDEPDDPSREPSARRRHSIEIGETRWVAFEHWDVESTQVTSGGLAVPMRCRLWRPGYSNQPDMNVTWVSAVPAPPNLIGRLMNEPPVESARVLDGVRGLSYSVDASGETLTADDAQFNTLIQLGRSHYGLSTRATVRARTPWRESSCGPNALLLLLYLIDAPRDLTQILGALPGSHAATRETTLAELGDVCTSLGIARALLKTPIDALRRLNVPALARVRSGLGGENEAHFVVVECSGDEVFVTSIPEGRARMTIDEFAKIFVGEVLLASNDPAQLEAVIGRASESESPRNRYLLGCAIAISGLVAASWALRRRIVGGAKSCAA